MMYLWVSVIIDSKTQGVILVAGDDIQFAQFCEHQIPADQTEILDKTPKNKLLTKEALIELGWKLLAFNL